MDDTKPPGDTNSLLYSPRQIRAEMERLGYDLEVHNAKRPGREYWRWRIFGELGRFLAGELSIVDGMSPSDMAVAWPSPTAGFPALLVQTLQWLALNHPDEPIRNHAWTWREDVLEGDDYVHNTGADGGADGGSWVSASLVFPSIFPEP